MNKNTRKETKKRVRSLAEYVDENGWLKVAHFAGYKDTAACKAWIKRESIPDHVWGNRLEKLVSGEVEVEIRVK